MNYTKRIRTVSFLLFCCFATTILLLSGCNILGPVAILLAPDPSQEAEYALPDRKTVVFVDDRRNVLKDRRKRVFIGNEVVRQLTANEVLTYENGIDSSSALKVTGNEQTGNLKSIEQIGQDIEATQLIYVEMLTFIVHLEGVPKAQATLRVKVIDCNNRLRLYPIGEDNKEGRPIIVDLPTEQALQPLLSRTAVKDAEETLARMVSDRVAKLFYKHDTGRGLNRGS